MANDKNPTEQLRTRQPATHSERNFAPDHDAPTGNPWDALQDRQWQPRSRWDPRKYKIGTVDWVTVLVWLGLGALAIVLALLLA